MYGVFLDVITWRIHTSMSFDMRTSEYLDLGPFPNITERFPLNTVVS